MLNILNLKTHEIMLGSDVDRWFDAVVWLHYYRENYGNGYQDNEFIIVRAYDGTQAYAPVH